MPGRAHDAAMTEPRGGRAGLIPMLRASVDRDVEEALLYCEETIDGLTVLPHRDRDLGLRVMRFGAALQITLAEEARGMTPREEAYFTDYFCETAERGIPLETNIQIIRRQITFLIHRYWQVAGPQYTDAMLAFTSGGSRFHLRLEQLLVDAYCRRLGTEVATERLRTAHARALLDGEPAPATGAGGSPSDGYLVLVIPEESESPAPLSALSSDPRVLHTVRDGADVVLVPHGPGGRAIADELASGCRHAGRRTAVASPAGSAQDVPAAYRTALRLLAVAPALRVPPTLITAEDALPESLLGSDPVTTQRLADILDRLAEHPDLVDTVTAFLDADMDRSTSAERLHIHRRTLTQRLNRIRELTGHDPRSTRGVQVLGLALSAREVSHPDHR